ncbi:AAA family ATPase [archaeon]|nr:AAA family ATPase [archaeon]
MNNISIEELTKLIQDENLKEHQNEIKKLKRKISKIEKKNKIKQDKIDRLKNPFVLLEEDDFINDLNDIEKNYIHQEKNITKIKYPEKYISEINSNLEQNIRTLYNDYNEMLVLDNAERNKGFSIKKNNIETTEKELYKQFKTKMEKDTDLTSSIGRQVAHYISQEYIMIFKTTTLKSNIFTNKLLSLQKQLEQIKIQHNNIVQLNKEITNSLLNHQIQRKYVEVLELTKQLNIHQHTIEVVHVSELSNYLKSVSNARNNTPNIGSIELRIEKKDLELMKKTVKNTTFKGTGTGKLGYIKSTGIYRITNTITDKKTKDSLYIATNENEIENTEHLVNYLTKYISKGKSEMRFVEHIDFENKLSKEELYLKHKLEIETFSVSLNFFDSGMDKHNFETIRKIVKNKYTYEAKNNNYNQKRSWEQNSNIKPNTIKLLSFSENTPRGWDEEEQKRKYIHIKKEGEKFEENSIEKLQWEIDKENTKSNYKINKYRLQKNDHIRNCHIDNSKTTSETPINPNTEYNFLTREEYIRKNMGTIEEKNVDLFKKINYLINEDDIKNRTFFKQHFYLNQFIKDGHIEKNGRELIIFDEEIELDQMDKQNIKAENMIERNNQLIEALYDLKHIDEIVFFGKEAILKQERNNTIKYIIERDDIQEIKNINFKDDIEELNAIINNTSISFNNKSNIQSILDKEQLRREKQLSSFNNKNIWKDTEKKNIKNTISYKNIFTKTSNENNLTDYRVKEFYFYKTILDFEILNSIKNKKRKEEIIIQTSLILGYLDGHNFLNREGLKYYSNYTLNDKILDKRKNNFNIVNGYWFITSIYEKLNDFKNIIQDKVSIKQQGKIYNHTNIEIDFEGFTLAEQQNKAIDMALKENVMVLTGGPGSGKTLTSKFIIKSLKKLKNEAGEPLKIDIVAPTGAAAKRISNVSGEDASTIHKLLKLNHQGVSNVEDKLDSDIIVIDESSMIDNFLAYQLFLLIKPTTKLIFIGDVNQIKPVNNGAFFKTLLDSIPTTKLNKTFRQSEDSGIVSVANNFLNNKNETLTERYIDINKDIQIIQNNNNNNYEKNLIDTFMKTNGTKQILSDSNITSRRINRTLQNKFKQEKIPKTIFRLKDRVMATKNRYDKDIMNGELGYIHSYSNNKNGLSILIVFDNGIIEEYWMNELKEIKLAYCISIHKSQGNEWENVLIVNDESNFLNKNLLYTGLTRAKLKCFIYIDENLLDRTIKTNDKLYLLTKDTSKLPTWENFQVYNIEDNNYLKTF